MAVPQEGHFEVLSVGRFLSELQLAAPEFTWLLLLLPFFWWHWGRGARWIVLLRSLTMVLLVLGLAQPERNEVRETAEQPGRIFALDFSNSVQDSLRQWMLQLARDSATASGADEVWVFAGEAKEVEDLERVAASGRAPEGIAPERTSLKNLFEKLLSSKSSRHRSVYLFTDGWENHGNVEEMLGLLSQSPLRVVPVVPSGAHAPNVVVTRVHAPGRAEAGETVELRVSVHNMNPQAVHGNLLLSRNGREFARRAVLVEPGRQLLTHKGKLEEPGLTAFEARFVPKEQRSDAFTEDSKAIAWVSAESKQKVLLVNGSRSVARYLDPILRRQGFKVTSIGPEDTLPSPDDFGVVIFNNVRRARLPAAYLASVRRYVAEGGSFMMLGAEGSFGSGGYRDTAIEQILPVALEERKQKPEKRGIVLVIDKSGSMRMNRKLVYAKEAAKALAAHLKERDLIGVIGFDISPFEVAPLATVAEQRHTLPLQVDRLKPGGKTYLYPAILQAKRALERSNANLKHVMILSDGETGGSGSDYVDLVSVMHQDLKITVSAIAIGDKANVPLLKRLAMYGGGAFHHTYDPSTLPRIVTGEVKQKPARESERPRKFYPRLDRKAQILRGFSGKSFPPLEGYVRTELKKKAVADLRFRSSDDRNQDPLLASWRYGKGKTVAFTADLHGRWSESWIRWNELDPFWDRVLEWLAPGREQVPSHEVRVNPTGDGTVMDLYVYESGNAGAMEYAVRGDGAERRGLMRLLAPGHYRAEIPISKPGPYRIRLQQQRGGRKVVYPEAGYTIPFDLKAELPRERMNIELLTLLARSTGGNLNHRVEPDTVRETIERTTEPLYGYFVLVAAILFLLEVFVRRFSHGVGR